MGRRSEIYDGNHTYRKFPNRGARGLVKAFRALSLERGHFHLPAAFYRMKIGQFLAEILPKTSRNPVGLGSKGISENVG